MSLQGKTAVVTGSNSGIGLGIAREFARAGANVVINSFTDDEKDHELAKKIASEFGVEARYIQADMSDGEQCRALIDKAGTCDILVNNAGIQHVERIDKFPVDTWNRIIAINMNSAFHTIAAALPKMRSAGWGRVINIASAHGLTASPYKSAYVTAKHGLLGLCRTVAKESGEKGVRTNVICPGFVRTPLVDKQIPEQAKELGISEQDVISKVMLKNTVDGEFTTLEDVAEVAVHLAAFPSAALTGQSIVVSHGWHMQ